MGFVARGGIRWSDRREDFRTEVLGLMKAQQVKNTVIVARRRKKGASSCVGLLTGERDAQLAEVIRVLPDADPRHARPHRQHRRGQDRLRRRGALRHDGDDAYLVVAADKGTADLLGHRQRHFRGIRVFGSRDALRLGRVGGLRPQEDGDYRPRSLGMRGNGISAKSASTFRKRISRWPGSGTWRGDVFRQRHAPIPAHPAGCGLQPPAHIPRSKPGCGPAPIANASGCFRLPRFLVGRLLQGGHLQGRAGIYPRSAKSLSLSREAQDLLELPAQATPNEVIRGHPSRRTSTCCGTAGSAPTSRQAASPHIDVGDRSNDAVRIGRLPAQLQGHR